jgi:hypothetical protein
VQKNSKPLQEVFLAINMVKDKIITPKPPKTLTLSTSFLPILETKKFGPIPIH